MAYYVCYAPYDFARLAEAKTDMFVNDKGNHECVEFVRKSTGAPSSRNWRPGAAVKGLSEVPQGVAIATFKNKRFSTHAAVYLAQDDRCIWVLDQWNKQGMVLKRPIRFPNGKEKISPREQNDGNKYFIIDTVDTEEAAREAGEIAKARVI
jgi:hypothetical protein